MQNNNKNLKTIKNQKYVGEVNLISLKCLENWNKTACTERCISHVFCQGQQTNKTRKKKKKKGFLNSFLIF